MGYIGNFIGVGALIPLPFAGYYLGREIYSYNEQMGISMMGGIFSWLFIIQAVLIGVLFLSANYYLWLGMERIPGAERYRGWIKFLLLILTICFGVWMTPQSGGQPGGGAQDGWRPSSLAGRAGGDVGQEHRGESDDPHHLLEFYALQARQQGPDRPLGQDRKRRRGADFRTSGDHRHLLRHLRLFRPAIVRIGFSVYQVGAVLFTLIAVTVIDIFLLKNAQILGEIQWGKIPSVPNMHCSLLALSFTWLMGLMGYVRSGLRMDWHVYGVMRDTSPGAYTPTLGFATNMVSVTVIIFLGLLAFIFWLGPRRGSRW